MFIYFILIELFLFFFFSESCDFERDEEVNGVDTFESSMVQNQQTEPQQSLEDECEMIR